ncbi:BPI fold-containing family B member 4-like [Terrapene carolina triunguis]|uniref:BPI fold-containing family B member 4-like n=1 Tax=Terrapene triunguis TaxID=2587831 RepID=UPI000CF00F69|nr:BPI fold-containing family B member 4-like [Terrapene carolina triunguis]
MLKVLGIVLFCSLLPLSQGVVPGVFSVVSPEGIQNVVSGALLQDGLLQKHLQAIQIPDIVSGGGLLGSFISITGLEVVNVQLPTVSVTLLPGIGGQLTIATKLEINGNLLLSGLIHISVDVNLNAKVRVTNYSEGDLQFVIEDCQSLLGPFDIRLLSGLLPISVNGLVSSTLTTTLPSLLCPVVNNIVTLLKVQILGTVNVLVPLGAVGEIQYQLASLPLITDLHVGLDLNTVFHQVGGGNISLPVSAVPVALPALQGNVLNLGLSQAFLNAALSLLVQIQPQTFISTLDVFSGATQLMDAIVALIPAGCPNCSVVSPLNIEITILGPPLITLEANKATVKLSVKIQVFTKYLDGTIQTLLALKADLVLNAQASVAGDKLLLSVSLTSAALVLESSDVGIVSLSGLGTLINKLLVETFVPLINDALAVGLPLPNVLGIKLIDAVQIVEGLVVVRV